jgi:hypothetical protein
VLPVTDGKSALLVVIPEENLLLTLAADMILFLPFRREQQSSAR